MRRTGGSGSSFCRAPCLFCVMVREMKKEFVEAIEASPVIAAVKNEIGLAHCLKSDVGVVFVLYGDVCSIADIVERIKEAGKTAVVHLDLIAGLSTKDAATDFIRRYTRADGIITTKSSLIAHANELGLGTICRYFILDSMALETIGRISFHGSARPDLIEILPGILAPKMIRQICDTARLPVICGGLIKNREDTMNALKSGASAISTTSENVWFM